MRLPSTNLRLLAVFSAIVMIATAAAYWRSAEKKATGSDFTPQAPPSPAAETTIEASGEILGVAIGSKLEDVRKKLDPLRAPDPAYVPDLKDQQGRRVYWKLKETDYDWLIAWANPEGKVTRFRVMLRRENAKPFTAIGDLQTATSLQPEAVKWTLRDRDGVPYRLIAQGADNHALSVYMFSLTLPTNERLHTVENLAEAE